MRRVKDVRSVALALALALALASASAVAVAGASAAPAASGLAPPAPVLAQSAAQVSTVPTCPLGLTVSAHLDPAGGQPSTVCSGQLLSFDGTPLSADVTLPDAGHGPRPMVVFLNGWGSNKSNFESTQLSGNSSPYTYHWNNAWFASHGFAVLNYTARGFWHSCGKVPVSGVPSLGGITAFDPVYLTEPGCAGKESWTHLADRKWEVRDTQTLVGELVDAGVANPNEIVVTGDSYGGGQSWLLAMSQNQVMRRDGTTEPWRSPDGVPIHLAAAVPLFGWTDLAQALIDNGGAAIAESPAAGAPAATSHLSPVGVEKLSYVTGLFGLGESTAQYAPPGVDPNADLTAWFADASAGEPYAANPQIPQVLDQMAQYRSAWYMPVPPMSRAVPIFTVQGVTDPLFPATQSLQMEQRLRAAHPGYPVWTTLADVGHSYADNPPAVWDRILGQANAWLTSVLDGRQPTQPKMTVATVDCLAGQSTTWLSANHLRSLATTVLTSTSNAVLHTTNVGANLVENEQTDPITNGGCRTLSTSTADPPGTAAITVPLPDSPVTLLDAPVVRADAQLLGTSAVLSTTLWAVDPSTGQQTLVTRSVKRLTGTPGQVLPLAFELWPTAWPVPAGDELQLQFTQDDVPTWRLDNLPSALVISHVQVRLPVVTSAATG